VAGPTTAGSGTAAVRSVRDEVIKEMNAHGVSVIEIGRSGESLAYKKDSSFNRRITSLTEMRLSGPAAGSALMITAYSPDGSKTRGTVANCANGHTPWGTYLTCEENWAGFFRRLSTDDANRTKKELASFRRYGVAGNGGKLWATATPSDASDTRFARWNAMKTGTSVDGSDDFRNGANTYGWVVEIDPFDPGSTPVKRTAWAAWRMKAHGRGASLRASRWPGTWVATRATNTSTNTCRTRYGIRPTRTRVWPPATSTSTTASCMPRSSMPMAAANGWN
jgi:secreted PhoX family phosphatase